MFFTHRTGDYGEMIYRPSDTKHKRPIDQGPSTRRCLTDEEMCAMGWLLQTVLVDVIVEEVKTKRDMPTWVLPGQLEAREKHAERMREMSKSYGFKKGREK
jgi:hypothetical protein